MTDVKLRLFCPSGVALPSPRGIDHSNYLVNMYLEDKEVGLRGWSGKAAVFAKEKTSV